MDELDLTNAEKKATYQEIKDYVMEHNGLNVGNLYIAQVNENMILLNEKTTISRN